MDFYLERMSSRTRNKGEAELSRKRKDNISKLRKGKELTDEDKKGFTNRQLRRQQTAAKLDPRQVKYQGLSVRQALNVYNLANDEERDLFFPILLKKIERSKTLTKDERTMFNELKITEERRNKGLSTIKNKLKHTIINKAKNIMRMRPMTKSKRDKWQSSIDDAFEWMDNNGVTSEDVIKAYLIEMRNVKNKEVARRNLRRLRDMLKKRDE